MLHLLHAGEGVLQMMQVSGEEGVTMADYVTHQKALFLDMVYLQQDAFDPVDLSAPLARQQRSFHLVYGLVTRDYDFADKAAARDYFTRLTGLFKNLNYAREDSPDLRQLLATDRGFRPVGEHRAGAARHAARSGWPLARRRRSAGLADQHEQTTS